MFPDSIFLALFAMKCTVIPKKFLEDSAFDQVSIVMVTCKVLFSFRLKIWITVSYFHQIFS